jgi:hypothetical protein
MWLCETSFLLELTAFLTLGILHTLDVSYYNDKDELDALSALLLYLGFSHYH